MYRRIQPIVGTGQAFHFRSEVRPKRLKLEAQRADGQGGVLGVLQAPLAGFMAEP